MSISSTEIIIVALVALIALGPQRLPEALRTAGKMYRQFKDVTGSVQREINSVVNETTGMVTDTAKMITEPMAEITRPAPSTKNDAFRPDGDDAEASGKEISADNRPADEMPADEMPADLPATDDPPGPAS